MGTNLIFFDEAVAEISAWWWLWLEIFPDLFFVDCDGSMLEGFLEVIGE